MVRDITVFYDQLKDEASDASITIMISALLRMKLEPDKTIECCGFLTEKVQINGVPVLLSVTAIHSEA